MKLAGRGRESAPQLFVGELGIPRPGTLPAIGEHYGERLAD